MYKAVATAPSRMPVNSHSRRPESLIFCLLGGSHLRIGRLASVRVQKVAAALYQARGDLDNTSSPFPNNASRIHKNSRCHAHLLPEFLRIRLQSCRPFKREAPSTVGGAKMSRSKWRISLVILLALISGVGISACNQEAAEETNSAAANDFLFCFWNLENLF